MKNNGKLLKKGGRYVKRFFEIFRGSRKVKIQTLLGLAMVLVLLVGAVVMKTNDKLAAAEVSGNSSETTAAAPLPELSMDSIMPRASTAGVYFSFVDKDDAAQQKLNYIYTATQQYPTNYFPITPGSAPPSPAEVYEGFKAWYKTLPNTVKQGSYTYSKFPIKEGTLVSKPGFMYYSPYSVADGSFGMLTYYAVDNINTYNKVMSGAITTPLNSFTTKPYLWDNRPATLPTTVTVSTKTGPLLSVMYVFGDLDAILPSSVSPKEVTKPFGYPAYGSSGSWSWTPTANELKDWVTVQDDSGNPITNYSVQLKNATNVNTGKVGETSYTVTVTYTDNNGKQSEDVDVPVTILHAEMRVSNGDDGHFKVGAGQPSANTLKSDYFTGKVNMVSVNADGSQAGVLENAIGTGSYSTTLKSPTWNSSGNPNPVTYKVDVTYDYTSGKYYNVLKSRTVQADWKAYYESVNPLQIILEKTDKDTGAPLAGATFQLQRQNKSSGEWSGFVVDGNSTYVTDSNGQIILPQSVLDAIKVWGGDDDNYRFRFKETEAPNGYVQPTGDSMVTAPQEWTAKTEGPQTLTMTNTKEAPKAAKINVRYYIEGTSTPVNPDYSFTPFGIPVGGSTEVPANGTYKYNGYTYHLVSYKIDNGSVTQTSGPIKTTVQTTEKTVYYYYRKEVKPAYAIKQLKIPEQTYNAGIDALTTDTWKDLFTGGMQLAVVDTNKNDEIQYYLTANDFTPSLPSGWNSSEGTRTFNVTITPTSTLTGKYTGVKAITAQATLTFKAVPKDSYQFRIVVRNQDGEAATFEPTAQPFEAYQLPSPANWQSATINPVDRTLVEFPNLNFQMNEQYRIRQTEAPNDDYTIWENGNQTKAFSMQDENTLWIAGGAGVGVDDFYNIANREVKISDGWWARYDTGAKTLTFYITNQEEASGELTWTVPDDMDFGKVETPIRQQKDIFLQAEQPNWKILVNDQRNKNRNQWDITAQLTTPLTNTVNQKQLAKNILKFKSTANGTAQDLSQATQIYQSAANPALGDTPITWNSTSGFYLDLISNGYYPVGQYVGNVTFTLNTTP